VPRKQLADSGIHPLEVSPQRVRYQSDPFVHNRHRLENPSESLNLHR
ncbi:uncharacterized protein METZ01_LOCUS137736, partial [marine metagenome]